MLFMMSCDRLTIELDDVSLRLVLSLLDVNSESNDVVGGCEDSERTRLKVLELCRAAVNSSRISFLDLRLQDMTVCDNSCRFSVTLKHEVLRLEVSKFESMYTLKNTITGDEGLLEYGVDFSRLIIAFESFPFK